MEAGADPNTVNLRTGCSPLHYAACAHPANPSLVKLLLHYGAEPYMPDDFNITAICYASVEGNSELLTLFSHYAPSKALPGLIQLRRTMNSTLKHVLMKQLEENNSASRIDERCCEEQLLYECTHQN